MDAPARTRTAWIADALTAPRMMYPVEAAAFQVGIGRSKFFELLRDGSIASVKVGSRRLVAHDDLQAFKNRLQKERGAEGSSTTPSTPHLETAVASAIPSP